MYATKSLNNVTNIHVAGISYKQWYNFVKTADRRRQRLV